MRNDIAVIDPARDADWPLGTAPGVRRYLSALATQGPAHFLANGTGIKAEILRAGEQVVPLLVSDGYTGKASMLEPLAHHVYYPIEEISKKSTYLTKPILTLLCAPLVCLFRFGRLNQVAFLNHWLMTASPPLDLPAETWRDLVRFVAQRHPNHAVLVPDVVKDLDPALHANLMAAGGEAIKTRVVGVFDPKTKFSGKANQTIRTNLNGAQRLLESAADSMVGVCVGRQQTDRLTGLYRESYIDRHSRLNPDYTRAFFELVLQCEEFPFHGWADGQGRIKAFSLQRRHARRIISSAFGRSTSASKNEGLYMLKIAVDLESSKKLGLPLYWGSGADQVKKFRGATPHRQVEMVFSRHLPWHRRATWYLLRRLRDLRSGTILEESRGNGHA